MPLAFFGGIGPLEMVVIGTIAVLLFGSRLPSVARSAGKSLTEFKRGMQDLQSDFRQSVDLEETMKHSPPSGTPSALPASTGDSPPAAETVADADPSETYEGYPAPRSPTT